MEITGSQAGIQDIKKQAQAAPPASTTQQTGNLSKAAAALNSIADAKLSPADKSTAKTLETSNYDPKQFDFSSLKAGKLEQALNKPVKTGYQGDMKEIRDASLIPVTSASISDLEKNLKLQSICTDKSDHTWTKNPKMQALVEKLDKNGKLSPAILTYLEKIYKDHGPAVAEKISENLVNYMNSPDYPGIDQDKVVLGVLHDVAYPSNIKQCDKGTCAATAVQMKLAIENPAEYVKMTTTLARGQDYTSPAGGVIKPNHSWKHDENDPRTESSKIMQTSLMAACKSYDAKKDDGTSNTGLDSAQSGELAKKIFDKKYETHDKTPVLKSSDAIYKEIEDDIARGKPVLAGFHDHAVLVVGIDKTQTPHRVIIDSWGKQHSMTVDDFKKHLVDAETYNDGTNNKQVASGSKVIYGDK